jgi:hypothetical protein
VAGAGGGGGGGEGTGGGESLVVTGMTAPAAVVVLPPGTERPAASLLRAGSEVLLTGGVLPGGRSGPCKAGTSDGAAGASCLTDEGPGRLLPSLPPPARVTPVVELLTSAGGVPGAM